MKFSIVILSSSLIKINKVMELKGKKNKTQP